MSTITTYASMEVLDSILLEIEENEAELISKNQTYISFKFGLCTVEIYGFDFNSYGGVINRLDVSYNGNAVGRIEDFYLSLSEFAAMLETSEYDFFFGLIDNLVGGNDIYNDLSTSGWFFDTYTGDDILNGGMGDDVLSGGEGINVIDGGDGTDTAGYIGEISLYTISMAQDGIIMVEGNGVSDTLISVESLLFADRTVKSPILDDGGMLNGTSDNDILIASFAQTDTVVDEAGIDTVILPMFPNVYSLAQEAPGRIRGTYAGYSLTLEDVELATFGSTFQTTIPVGDLVSGSAKQQLDHLTDLYLAFFGRAPDVSGLEFWQEQLLERGRDFATISKDFAWSVEAQRLFPQDDSNREFVKAIYQNCFDRDPDTGGWDYWTQRLDALGSTDLNDRGSFVGELILGAYAPTSGDEDRSLLTHKHEVALHYVNRLSVQLEEGFDASINDLLERVTGDAVTQSKAEAVIDYVFEDPITLTGVMSDPVLFESIWGA